MSSLYSHPDFPNKGPKDINKELMNRVSSNPLRLLLPQHITNYIQALWTKKATGQPVTFTDIFGMLIGETLIPAVRASWQLGFVLMQMGFLISLSHFYSPLCHVWSDLLFPESSCFISSFLFLNFWHPRQLFSLCALFLSLLSFSKFHVTMTRMIWWIAASSACGVRV